MEPKFEELFHMHPECGFWYGRCELVTMHENSMRLRICTPKTLRNDLLWHFHDLPISGHQGVLKTRKRADMSLYYRPNFYRDISDYVKSCNKCEEKKNPSKKKRDIL